MYQVLLIDDDGKLAELLSEYCAQFSIQIEPALAPSQGLSKLKAASFDAVILDVMLPEMDGFDVIRTLRRTNDIPIVMLTARGDVTDRIVGLELGADDYLPKPFDPRELVARVQGNIKRHQSTRIPENLASDQTQEFEGFSIETSQREITVEGKPVELTTMEFQLLTMLMSEPGRAFTRDEILASLKGTQK